MAEIKTCYGCKYLEDMRCSNKEAHYFRGFQCSKYTPKNSKEIIAEQLSEIAENIYRKAEKVPVVVEKAGTVTNGDRIRAMTDDEQLADFLRNFDMCIGCQVECAKEYPCEKGILAWLKQEV